MVDSENDLRDKFIQVLTGFEQGHLPSFTHQDYLAAGKELNLHYTRLLADLNKDLKDPESPLCPDDDIRPVERTWIIYRDAWVAFAKVRWPQVSADSWLTLLTQERTNQLGTIDELPISPAVYAAAEVDRTWFWGSVVQNCSEQSGEDDGSTTDRRLSNPALNDKIFQGEHVSFRTTP